MTDAEYAARLDELEARLKLLDAEQRLTVLADALEVALARTESEAPVVASDGSWSGPIRGVVR